MNEKQTENSIQNLIALRNYYNTIVIALTGGLIGLMYNLTAFNKVLLCIGIVIDIVAYFKAKQITHRINNLIKRYL